MVNRLKYLRSKLFITDGCEYLGFLLIYDSLSILSPDFNG